MEGAQSQEVGAAHCGQGGIGSQWDVMAILYSVLCLIRFIRDFITVHFVLANILGPS